jgi:biotin carboxylase
VRPDPKVLVVGTTPDYIHWIRQGCPDQALFITDPLIRARAMEPTPSPGQEILCDLSGYDRVRQALENHLSKYNQRLVGVACFDCESMELAAVLARRFSLPYPTVAAVGNCRNKYHSKILWQLQNLSTPPVKLVHSEEEVIRFKKELATPVVLKPLSGSGSELIFVCTDDDDCRQSYRQICSSLRQRRNQRLYADFSLRAPEILAEGMVAGQEYSCDFAVQNGRCDVIRLTRKIRASCGPFGTTRAYLLPVALPAGMDDHRFSQTLFQSASALGIDRAVCMLDFLMDGDRMVLLELAPRPGGDCLPFLLRRAYHLDMLKLQLDFARQWPLQLDLCADSTPMVGLRVHVHQHGVLKDIDTSSLASDPRIREIHLPRQPGHKITLPPEDYDAWLLGHVIFAPDGLSEIEDQCRDLMNKIRVEVETPQKDIIKHAIL